MEIGKYRRGRFTHSEIFESNRLNLMGMLPINLRHFLADRLGPMLRIEGDSVLAVDPRWGDLAIRELARAIRRFSAERARELWRECAVKLDRLTAELARIPGGERHVILCMRCGSITVGADAISRHRESSCFPIELNRALGRGSAGTVRALVCSGLRKAVEAFRHGRAAAGLPHYDLDCYLSADQIIFTWRPLPVQSHSDLVVDVPAFGAVKPRPSGERTTPHLGRSQ